jgi:PST family polysaccharide transporter
MFAAFILTAMAADFHPRLSAVGEDNEQVNLLVNQQTEVGMLLALPGLLGSLAFGPGLMRLCFTPAFLPGAELLPWFVLGVFGQVFSWPMGFALVAKGAKRRYLALETIALLVKLALGAFLLKWLGLLGIALVTPVIYALYGFSLRLMCGQLTGFQWTTSVHRVLLQSAAMVLVGFLLNRYLPGLPGYAAGALLTIFASVISVRGIAHRVGHEHRIVKLVSRLPGGRFVVGLR